MLLLARFQGLLDDAAFALELAELEAPSTPSSSSNDSSELASVLAQARSSLQQLAVQLDKWELRMLLSGPYDTAGALLTITAGAGEEGSVCVCVKDRAFGWQEKALWVVELARLVMLHTLSQYSLCCTSQYTVVTRLAYIQHTPCSGPLAATEPVRTLCAPL